MRILISGLLVIMTLGVAAQQDTVFNRTNVNGEKEGWWKKAYSDGSVQYIGFFSNGKPIGEVRRYSPLGKLSSILTYMPGGVTVQAKLFNQDGQLLAEGNYVNMKKEGTWTTYRSDGSLLYVEVYSNGQREGKSIGYYANKQKMFEFSYSNGVKVGYAVQYFSNGSMMEELVYNGIGQPNSDYRAFYENNAKRIVGKYKNGEKEGEWTTYQPNGVVVSKVTYKDGYPQVSDEMLKKETDMLNSYRSMKGKIEEPTEENINR